MAPIVETDCDTFGGIRRRLRAVEVKLATTAGRDDTSHLRGLGDRLRPDLVDTMIVTTGRHAYRDRDGIAVAPVALLGP